MQLRELQELNLDAIKDALCVVAAGHRMELLGEEMQCLSQAFRARGTFHLLQSADLAAFSMNLQRSGQARRYFLRKSREQLSPDLIFTALSRTDVVFDCIASGDWRLANAVGALSPSEWQREGEYEEDFCYHGLLHAHIATVLGDTPTESPAAWHARLERAVADVPDAQLDAARLDLCSTLLGQDAGSFWQAFERLVVVSGELADGVPLSDGRVFEFPWLAAERFISVELLAWLDVGRRKWGLPPQAEYKRCPSMAWAPDVAQPAPDIFVELEQQFGL